ncbi:hypothetical protein Tco_1216791 [Tanacetum coccineum]
MGVAAMKHMASNFTKLDKFEGVDFRRWQKKMYFLLSSMSVVYVLTTPIHEDGDDATMEQLRKRVKWHNDDYVCKGLILNGMSDSLFDIYQSVESSKELWDSLEAKYMAEDSSIMEQYNELLGILGRFTQHKMNMDEAIQLGSHLCIEESLRVQDSNKPKGNNVVGPSFVNMVERNNSSGTMTTRVNVNIMITQGMILTRRQNLLVGNVVKLVTLKGIAKVLMLETKLMVQAQKVRWMVHPTH